jgi:hypothetical protein
MGDLSKYMCVALQIGFSNSPAPWQTKAESHSLLAGIKEANNSCKWISKIAGSFSSDLTVAQMRLTGECIESERQLAQEAHGGLGESPVPGPRGAACAAPRTRKYRRAASPGCNLGLDGRLEFDSSNHGLC